MSRKTAIILSLGLLPYPVCAQAQDTVSTATSDIVVTGTRVSERTATTSPVPIDVLKGEEIRA
ncbi:MAG: hypothetical protein JHD35_00775, partial [Sphingopyxis sp.]|nr:hypothetical protein [Sphingopyxis sp.]